MATSEEIKLVVKSEMDKAIKDLKKFNTGLGKTEKETKGLTNSFKKMAPSTLAVVAGITALGLALKKTVDAASALEEATGKFNAVFGDTPELMEFATESVNELTEAYALSEREAKQYLGSIQDLLVPMGVMPNRAAAMSDRLVKLAADLGSFNDKAVPDVINDVTSALTGSFETMKKYGVVLNETTIKQEAMRQGLFDGKGMLDAATKSQVAYDLILRDTAAAHGDVARTADSYANTMKRLGSKIEDISAEIGKELLPSLSFLADAFMQGASDGNFLIKSFKFIARAGAQLATGLGLIIAAINQMNAASKQKDFNEAVADWRIGLNKVAPSLKGLKQGTQEFRNELKRLKKESPEVVKKLIPLMALQGKQAEGASDAATKRANISARAEKQIQALNGKTAETVDIKKRTIIKAGEAEKKSYKKTGDAAKDAAEKVKKAAEEKAKAEKKAAEDLKQGVKNVISFTGSALGEISNLYGQHTNNKVEMSQRAARAEVAALDEKMQRELEAAGVAEETATEQAEKKIEDLETELAAAESVEDRARINKQIKEQQDAIKRAQIIDKFNKKKLQVEEAAAAKERKLKRKAAEMQKNLSIAQTLLETPLAAMRAYSSAQVLGPGIGHAVGLTLAGIATALGAAKLAVIKSTPLPEAAEGGIIPGSQGGTVLRAGEGGRSEAIIPLENEDAMERSGLSGGGTTIILNIENLFADDDVPTELAVKIDQALTKLGQDENLRLGSVL